jgi:O-antigen ligase
VNRLLIFLGAETLLLSFVLAKRIVISPALMGIAIFLMTMIFFVQWRLPRLEEAAAALAAYLPFSRQLSQDLGALPTALQAVFAVLFLAGFRDLPALLKNDTDVKDRYKAWMKSPALIPFGILLIWALLSALGAAYTGDITLSRVFSQYLEIWIGPFLVYFIFFRAAASQESRFNIAAAVLFAVTGVALITLYESITLGNVHDLEDARIGGIANDPNILAAYLNLCAFLPVGILMNYFKEKRAWLALVPLFLILRALLTTYSRGGYLAFAAGLYAAAFLKKKILVVPLLIASLALALNPAVLPESMRQRIAQTFVGQNEIPVTNLEGSAANVSLDRSNRDRIDIWKGALQMTKEHPFMGVGFGLFKLRIAPYWPARVPFEPHNMYLLISSEMGIPALLVFLALLGAILRQGYLAVRLPDLKEQAFLLGALGGMISFLFSALYVIRLDSLEVSGTFWIFAALVMGFTVPAARKQEVLVKS